MHIKYKCDGCRSIVSVDETFDAGEYFSRVFARREYGRRGVVAACNLNSWTTDGRFCYYDAFIGVYNRSSRSTTGHNIHFVVESEVLCK